MMTVLIRKCREFLPSMPHMTNVLGVGLLLLSVLLILTMTFANRLPAQDDDLFGGKPDAPAGAPATPATPAAAPATPAASSTTPPPAAPAAPAAESNETTSRGDNYLVWMIRSLGWFFTPVFVVLSLTMVALMIMNIISIRRSNMVPEELVRQFGSLLDEAKYQDAYQVAKDDDSLLGKVLSAGLSRISSGYEKATQSMQDVGQEEIMRLEHQIGYLALIGNLAPMIGLFGTVVGMIDAFQVIAAGGAAPSPQKLAEGIATAMFTTMVGLAIALPSLAIYDVFKNRLARFSLEIGIVSDNFMSRFSSISSKKPQ